MENMSSRERMLAVIGGEKPDYVPCSIYFNNALRIEGYELGTPEGRVRCQMDLGTEPVVDVPLPAQGMRAGVSSRTWVSMIEGERHPVLFKEYSTPEGKLRQGVYLTKDWPFGNDIPFPGNDHCASNNYEPLLKTSDDIHAFEYLWEEPGEDCIESGKKAVSGLLWLSNKYSVLTRATVGQGLAVAMFCMGAENMVLFSMDYPEAFAKIAELEHRMTMKKIEIADYYGIDLLKKFGGYEQTNFFSPSVFIDIAAPLAKKEIIEAKRRKKAMYYRVVTGMKPLLGEIADIGFDCVEGFEPELSVCTNNDIKAAFSKKSTVWTGVSSPVHLGADSEEPVRKAVRDAMETFGDEGFILGVTNSIRPHWPWANTLAMVDEWKKLTGRKPYC
ncbi:MAG: hypothetical protein JXB33_00745 [Clostridia bacterium]|nr:hypothetical protein [Clostridia bacterium]